MADFTIVEDTKRRADSFHKRITLEAGEKLADDAQLVAISQMTVPAGYRIVASVVIESHEVIKL